VVRDQADRQITWPPLTLVQKPPYWPFDCWQMSLGRQVQLGVPEQAAGTSAQ